MKFDHKQKFKGFNFYLKPVFTQNQTKKNTVEEIGRNLSLVGEDILNGAAHLGPLQDVDDLFVGGAAALVLGPLGQHGENLIWKKMVEY